MGEAEGDLKVARSVGQGIILVLFCYLIINLSQFFAWFGYSPLGDITDTSSLCPVHLSSYLLYESVSSFLFTVLSTGIIAAAMVMSSGLSGRVATVFMVLAIISGIMRMMWNFIACYWLDTYPLVCRNSPVYKMTLASVILFFIMNTPIVLFHGRLITEKFLSFLNSRLHAHNMLMKPGINLKNLLNSPKYSDVMFEVDSVIFYGHKAILSSRCDYFAKLLYGGLRESTEIGPIMIKEVSAGAFLQILEYIYTNDIAHLDIKYLDDVMELMRCADLLSFNALKDFLESWLAPNLATNNLIPILVSSRKYNYATEALALAKIAKLKLKLKEADALMLKEEPDLLMQVVAVYA